MQRNSKTCSAKDEDKTGQVLTVDWRINVYKYREEGESRTRNMIIKKGKKRDVEDELWLLRY